MARQKLNRFEDNATNLAIIEIGKPNYFSVAGHWHEFFGNDNPIVLELACGYGEYTVGLAAEFPDKNFIGVDIKGNRIWQGGKKAYDQGLNNVAFLRCFIQNLGLHFNSAEVDEIWITFPDPRPKGRDEKRRLTHPRFLSLYQRLLKPDGSVHLKTDSISLFDYTKDVLKQMPVKDVAIVPDLYKSAYKDNHHGIKTRYEEMFSALGEVIKYLRFRFSGIVPVSEPNPEGFIPQHILDGQRRPS